ncbi:MAG: hypothetical protein WAW27_00440, partial [Chitinophagaceae bacterium]
YYTGPVDFLQSKKKIMFTMENLDIIILTTVVVVLFLVFILATIKEINEDAKKGFKGGKETGPRADMMEFIGRLFSDEKIEPTRKKELLNIIKEKMSDIEDESNKKGSL